jgi:hypothetical protein
MRTPERLFWSSGVECESFVLARDGALVCERNEIDLNTVFLYVLDANLPGARQRAAKEMHLDAGDGHAIEKAEGWYWRVWVPLPNEAPDIVPLKARE